MTNHFLFFPSLFFLWSSSLCSFNSVCWKKIKTYKILDFFFHSWVPRIIIEMFFGCCPKLDFFSSQEKILLIKKNLFRYFFYFFTLLEVYFNGWTQRNGLLDKMVFSPSLGMDGILEDFANLNNSIIWLEEQQLFANLENNRSECTFSCFIEKSQLFPRDWG